MGLALLGFICFSFLSGMVFYILEQDIKHMTIFQARDIIFCLAALILGCAILYLTCALL